MSHPSRIGRYEIRKELGRGGMGVVYEARDSKVGHKVALKILRTDRLAVGSPEWQRYVTGFVQEGKRMARLGGHPHIITVHDVELHEGVPYIVMNLFQGTALDVLIKEASGRSLPAEMVRSVMQGLGEALHYVHERGILHCDVKPSNVLVDPLGRPSLTDFGIARVGQDVLGAKPHEFVGYTPLYASPEQLSGADIGAASDQYSLGVVAYEMCTGKRPFAADGDHRGVAQAVLRGEPTPPSRVNARVSDELDCVILRALANDPGDRYSSVGHFVEDVVRALDDLETTKPTTPSPGGTEIMAGPSEESESQAEQERFSRMRRAFEEACDQPLADQIEFAQRRYTGDPEFVTELLRLLSVAQREPTEIGKYRIIEKLGEGGMGVVYKAEQRDPVQRVVALKLIRFGDASSSIVTRFEQERRALAVMEHEGIAKVFDCGTTDDGQPYFVMELVRGVPFDVYCEQVRLSLPDRLRLIQQVCDAVHHAHEKGVVHRDLKPGNVLVDDRGGRRQIKVIDFGLAKAMGHQLLGTMLHTELGSILGTPEFMAPEQANATGRDVDFRADIYSLGVMLYQVLVDELPFQPERLRRAGVNEMLRILLEEEPDAPSKRFATLGDARPKIAKARRELPESLGRALATLDPIVVKALDKDRNRRHGTARELAGDLQRFLDGKPVVADATNGATAAPVFGGRRILVGTVAMLVLGLALTLAIRLLGAGGAEELKSDEVTRRGESGGPPAHGGTGDQGPEHADGSPGEPGNNGASPSRPNVTPATAAAQIVPSPGQLIIDTSAEQRLLAGVAAFPLREGSVAVACYEVETNDAANTADLRFNENAADKLADRFGSRAAIAWPTQLREKRLTDEILLQIAKKQGAEFAVIGFIDARTTGQALQAEPPAYPWTIRVELRLFRLADGEFVATSRSFSDSWTRADSIEALVRKRVGQQLRELENKRADKGW